MAWFLMILAGGIESSSNNDIERTLTVLVV